MTTPRKYFYTDLCLCGWYYTPSFGDAWFSAKAHPVCPECGRRHTHREMVIGYLDPQPKKRWWHITKYKFKVKEGDDNE